MFSCIDSGGSVGCRRCGAVLAAAVPVSSRAEKEMTTEYWGGGIECIKKLQTIVITLGVRGVLPAEWHGSMPLFASHSPTKAPLVRKSLQACHDLAFNRPAVSYALVPL